MTPTPVVPLAAYVGSGSKAEKLDLSIRCPLCPRKRNLPLILELLPPPAICERRHRGLARRSIAVRGACDFSWISRLAKDQQQQP